MPPAAKTVPLIAISALFTPVGITHRSSLVVEARPSLPDRSLAHLVSQSPAGHEMRGKGRREGGKQAASSLNGEAQMTGDLFFAITHVAAL